MFAVGIFPFPAVHCFARLLRKARLSWGLIHAVRIAYIIDDEVDRKRWHKWNVTTNIESEPLSSAISHRSTMTISRRERVA